jgi:predicted Fe-Mo cluster-binding NifX family protein
MSTESPDVTTRRAVRVAIPSEHPGGLSAARSGHFGHCEYFTIVDMQDGRIGEVGVLRNIPHSEGGCMAPVMLLAQQGVGAIVVSGIGGRPLAGFNQVGIAVHAGVGETVEEAVQAYAADQLPEVGPEGACRH